MIKMRECTCFSLVPPPSAYLRFVVAGGGRRIALLKHFVGSGDGQVVRYAAKVRKDLFLPDIERLEQNDAALHIHVQGNRVPVIVTHVLLNNFERSEER